MELSPGAMGILLTKLEKLLSKEYHLKRRVKKGIKNLKAELETMQAKLVAVSDMPQDQLGMNDKLWSRELRSLSYAINDSLDPYMVHVEGLERFIEETRSQITKFRALYERIDNPDDVKTQGQMAPKKHPHLSAMYHKVSDRIEKAIGGVIKKNSEDDVAASEESGEDDDDGSDGDDDDDDSCGDDE